MRKISLAFLIFLFAFVFISSVRAEEPVSGWRVSACFSAEKCKYLKDTPNECQLGSSHHITRLTIDPAKKPPINSDIYITECVVVGGEQICTTADSGLDQNIQPIKDGNNLQRLIDGIKYNQVEEGKVAFYDSTGAKIGDRFTKLTTDALGNLILPGVNKQISYIEWKSHNPDQNYARNFKLWSPIVPVVEDVNPASGIAGQQQADLSYSGEEQTYDCEDFVSYDPEGRVFDAVTLDPIPNASVLLLQNEQNVLNGNYTKEAVDQYNTEFKITNPIITRSSNLEELAGSFNFFVVDGFYKLVPSHGEYNFLDTTAQSRLPVNTNKIYSQIYFSNSPAIEEKGKLEHRDIPLFPKNGTGTRYPETFTKIYDLTEAVTPTTTEYRGQVSHPFAKATVVICSTQNGQELCGTPTVVTAGNGGPDKNGKFNISLDQTKLKAGESYKVNLEYNADLTAGTLSHNDSPNFIDKFIAFITSWPLVGKVSAQTKSVSRTIEPIVSYLEGYAYDKQGKIFPNAQISIYVNFAKGPMVQTTANANGYFRLTSEFIPSTSYSLAYNSPDKPNEKTNISTSQFLAQNEEFIEAEKINPYAKTTVTNNPRRNVTPTFVPNGVTTVVPNPTDIVLAQQQPTLAPGEQDATATGQSNTIALVAAVLLLLLAAAGILLAVYLYKKRMAEGNGE